MEQGLKLSFKRPDSRVNHCVIDMLFDSLIDRVNKSFSVLLDDIEL